MIYELADLSESWRRTLLDSIQEEFCGLSSILEDKTIHRQSVDISYSVTVYLAGISDENYDYKTEGDKLDEAVEILEEKIEMELYRTRMSRLNAIKVPKVD